MMQENRGMGRGSGWYLLGLRSIMSVSLADRSVSSLMGAGTGNEAGTGTGVVVDTGDATSAVGEAMRKRGGKLVLLPRPMCTSNSAGKRLHAGERTVTR